MLTRMGASYARKAHRNSWQLYFAAVAAIEWIVVPYSNPHDRAGSFKQFMDVATIAPPIAFESAIEFCFYTEVALCFVGRG